MKICTLVKVVVVSESEEYQDHSGEKGVIVQVTQYPEDIKPSIKVLLDNGTTLSDLYDTDLKTI